MNPDLPQILQQLIDDAPGADAFHLRLIDDFAQREVTATETEAFFDELQQALATSVAEIAAAWGPPAYSGAVDSGDFPAWSEALVLAYWQRQDCLAFIALRHDDEHEPMFLEVAALTEDEVATLLTTHS